MKRKFWGALAALILAFQCLAAQNIRVLDQVSHEPLPGAKVINESKGQARGANLDGILDVSDWDAQDELKVSMVGYAELSISVSDALEQDAKVFLQPSDIALEEIVITVNRWDGEEIEMPARVEKIKMRDVRLLNPQTAADLLGTSGFAHIQKSQQAGGSPMLRGFATNRVMLVVDGVRMNNAIFRTGNLQNVISLDANGLQDAEIMFGPGAVMYGSDAIGGVMDFHTLDARLAGEDKFRFSGNAMGRFASANLEKTGHVDFNLAWEKFASVTSITVSDYDDLVAGKHGNNYFLRPSYQTTINGIDTILNNPNPSKQVASGYRQLNALQKFRFKPNEHWDFEYAFHYSATTDAPRYDRLVLDGNGDGVLDNAQWYYGPQKWMMNRIGITHSKANKAYDRMRLILAQQAYEESRHDRKFGSTKLRNQTENVDAISLNLDLDKKIGQKLDLLYGLEGVYNKVGSFANRVDIVDGTSTLVNTRYPNGSTWQSYGLYANAKYKLAEKWNLNAGLRLSLYRIEADFDTTLFPYPIVHTVNQNQSLNGSLGIVYSPHRNMQMYANASTGFRAPNVDDLGKVFESGAGTVVVPNTELKPEYAYNAELGFAKVFHKRMKLDASIFYTYLDNALARRPFSFNGQDSIFYEGQMSQVLAIQNISHAYVYGLQAAFYVNILEGLTFKGTFSYQKGKELSEDGLNLNPLTHAPPAYGSAHLFYNRSKLATDLYAQAYATMTADQLPVPESTVNFAKDENGEPFVPGFVTLNLKLSYFLSPKLVLNAGCENITNALYRPFGSGISASGRSFTAGIRLRWY